MHDPSMRSQCEWIAGTQGVSMTPDVLAEPARVVAQIGGLARGAAVALPFDSEPTGFTSYLELLAARFNSHG